MTAAPQSTRPGLPPLPEPDIAIPGYAKPIGYSAERMRADRRKLVELCAAVCIEQGRKADNIDSEAFYIATGQCAAALLALLDGETK